MAPRITVEFLGDTASLEQAFKRTTTEAAQFGQTVARANTIGARSFDRVSKSATTSTGKLRGLTSSFNGVGARSTYAGYRVQNLVTNIQSIGKESSTAAGSVNILLNSLGNFGIVGLGIAGAGLALTKLAGGITKVAQAAGVPGVNDKGVGAFQAALALQKRGNRAVSLGGVLGIADVAPAISQGFLDVAGLKTLKNRFINDQQFRDAIALAKENEKLRGQVPRRNERNPAQDRSNPKFLQPLNAAQQLKVSLASDPTNLTFLRQQIAADRRAISFAEKRRNELKITNSEFVSLYEHYHSDINATMSQIAAVTNKAKVKVTQNRLRLPGDLSGSFGVNDLSAFRGGIVPGGRVSGQFQKLAGGFEAPVGLRIAEARAAAQGNQAGLVSILKRQAAAAHRALNSGRLSALATIDAWNLIADINDRIKNTSSGDVSNFRKAGGRALAKGLGLSGMSERVLIARLSQATVPLSGSGAFGRIVVQNDVYLDGHKVETAVTKRQQTRARRNPPQKRGPYAGPH